ncbi:MAG TPA: hypothetical protein VD770_04545 [Coxiellaceae bacterium]|nr:hypothetical protein [Coxiellaceae bacterium]
MKNLFLYEKFISVLQKWLQKIVNPEYDEPTYGYGASFFDLRDGLATQLQEQKNYLHLIAQMVGASLDKATAWHTAFTEFKTTPAWRELALPEQHIVLMQIEATDRAIKENASAAAAPSLP